MKLHILFTEGEEWDKYLHYYLKSWKEQLQLWVILQDKHPVHILRYEDLKKDTIGELKKVLDFLSVSYNLDFLTKSSGYTEFYRPHKNTDFKHYSKEQKELLRDTLTKAVELTAEHNKSQLLRLEEYLHSI